MRPRIYEEERLIQKCISLTTDQAAALSVIGKGVISRGVRILVEKENETLQAIKDIQEKKARRTRKAQKKNR